MISLAIAEIKRHAATWTAALCIATACGYIGGFSAALIATGQVYENFSSLAFVVAFFSACAALPFCALAARRIVNYQRITYARWQLANISPRMVRAIVLIQVCFVALTGSALGTLLELVTFPLLAPGVFSSPFYQPIDAVAFQSGLEYMPLVWLTVAGVFLVGSAAETHRAAMVSPVEALRDLPENTRSARLRTTVFLVVLVSTCLVAKGLFSSAPEQAQGSWSSSLFLPLLVSCCMASVAPRALAALTHFWTRLVPARNICWHLACVFTRHEIRQNAAAEASVATAVGVAVGTLSLSQTLERYIALCGLDNINASLDFTSTVLLLGGPTLICIVGGASCILMGKRDRTARWQTLAACGAGPRTIACISILGLCIATMTALVAGIMCAATSDIIVCSALGLPVFCGFSPTSGIIIAGSAFICQLIALLHQLQRC